MPHRQTFQRAISILYWDFNPIFQTFQFDVSDISIRSPAHNTIWWNPSPTDTVSIVIITYQLPNCRYLVNAHQVNGWLTMQGGIRMIRRCGDNPKQENVISHRSACLLVGGKLAARNSIKVKLCPNHVCCFHSRFFCDSLHHVIFLLHFRFGI